MGSCTVVQGSHPASAWHQPAQLPTARTLELGLPCLESPPVPASPGKGKGFPGLPSCTHFPLRHLLFPGGCQWAPFLGKPRPAALSCRDSRTVPSEHNSPKDLGVISLQKCHMKDRKCPPELPCSKSPWFSFRSLLSGEK